MKTEQRPTDPRSGVATMRAIVQDVYGDTAKVLRPAEIARPEPRPGQVLVRVAAAGVDRGVWHLMAGKPYAARLAFGLRTPRNPVRGREFAGRIEEVGSGVTTLEPGDEVYGTGEGSFAEYLVASETKVAARPGGLTAVQAAAVPVSGITALQAVRDHGRVTAGQKVLVIGASGGVGSYAVQLAKALGAEVTGVASTGKLDLVRSLGADHVIDYTQDDFADGVHHYDLVLDIAGNPTISHLRSALTPTGTLVIVGGEEGGNFSGGMNRQLRAAAMSLFLRQRLTMFVATARRAGLEQLAELIEEGKVTPSVERTYPLDQAPEAMRHLVAGQVRGKVAITV